ncbi:MAG: hypothetical protein JNL58_16160 [Planctomyces sp.]|nr:hypothetical protein [Planctomyces sp.]
MTPLHQFGTMIRELLMQVPLSTVRALFLATLVGILVWVLMLPSDRTSPEGGVRRWDENLKIGASAALILQILAYAIF